MGYGPYPARVTRVTDGNTISVKIDLGFNRSISISCQVSSITVPRIDTSAGLASKAFAQTLLPVDAPIGVAVYSWNKSVTSFHGDITLPDGSNYAETMVNNGYASFVSPNKPIALKAANLVNS